MTGQSVVITVIVVVGLATLWVGLDMWKRRRRPSTGMTALRQAVHDDAPVKATIKRRMNGGFEVELCGVPGFLPDTHVQLLPLQDAAAWVGRTEAVKVIVLSVGDAAVVVSRRVLLEEQALERQAHQQTSLEVGAIVQGTVRHVTEFGLFIDLGGVDGMLHRSQLRGMAPSDAGVQGTRIRVRVMRLSSSGMPQLALAALE